MTYLLTIFTPTYNRAYLLPRLYDSLTQQKKYNFEWIIVDDGSEDDTKSLVQKWINKERHFPIRYYYQQNMGKMMAHNKGVLMSDGRFFFCVDSDDLLPENSTQIIESECQSIMYKEDIAGILGLKADLSGKSLGKIWPSTLTTGTSSELAWKYHMPGERSLIYKTNILRQYLFPKLEGNKFIPESLVYNRIDQKYKLKYIPTVMTLCEYQSDGYSKNIRRIVKDNPEGFQLYYLEKIDVDYSIYDRLKSIAFYHTYYNLSQSQKWKYTGKHKFLVNLFKPIGIIGYLSYLYIFKYHLSK